MLLKSDSGAIYFSRFNSNLIRHVYNQWYGQTFKRPKIMENNNLFFLSPKGLAKIKNEFNELKNIKLSKLAEESPKMIVSGDVNEEYLDYYQSMNLIDLKLRKLESVLRGAALIAPPRKEKRDMVFPGAKVVVESGGHKNRFLITGSAEADPGEGRISVESPVGSALLGRRVGEKIAVPATQTIYRILKVQYQQV